MTTAVATGTGIPDTGTTTTTETPEQKAAAAAAAAQTQTPEQKAAADKTAANDKAAADAKAQTDADTKAQADAAAAASKPPEQYVLTVPEGGRVLARDVARIETIAKANGWTNDQAQAALDGHAAEVDALNTAMQAETMADATYGGGHWPETQKLANSVLDKLRPAGTTRGDAFRSLLVTTGYGNSLEVISFLADLGKLMAEDRPAHAAGGGGGRKSDAEVLFGDAAKATP